jgi:hypothetical protein
MVCEDESIAWRCRRDSVHVPEAADAAIRRERDHFRWKRHSSAAALDSLLARAISKENRMPLFLIALWRRVRISRADACERWLPAPLDFIAGSAYNHAIPH